MSSRRADGKIFEVMRAYRVNGYFCDIQFMIRNTAFNAHKVVLAASSDYFRAMFLGGTQETAQSSIALHEITVEIFAVILDFIYGVELDIHGENVEDIIVAADMLRVTDIVECCEAYLMEQLDVHNCIGLHCFAKQRLLLKLEKEAWSFIMKNFHAVINKSQEFLSISFQTLDILTRSEEIAVKSEKDVLLCVARWLSHSPQKRRQKCVAAIRNIRKDLISRNEIIEVLDGIDDVCLRIAITVLVQGVPGGKITKEMPCKPCQPRISARKGFYVIGGCTYRPTSSPGRQLEHYELEAVSYMERYDSFSKEWDRHPISLRKARTALAAVQVDRKIYSIGGEMDSIIYGIIECYDTASKSWKRDLPSMVVPRTSFQAITHGCQILILGGDVGSGAGKSIESYDITTNQSKLLTFQMQTERHSFGATCYDNVIYMAGGIGLSERELRTMECYDLQRHDWWFAKDMTTKRANFALVSVDSTIYAIGGHNSDSGTLSSVEKYDMYKNVWTRCAAMMQARAGAFVSIMDSKIVVVGGKCWSRNNYTNPAWQILGSSEVYDCEKDVWTQHEELSVGLRCDGATVVI